MHQPDAALQQGLRALRAALADVLAPAGPVLVAAGPDGGRAAARPAARSAARSSHVLLSESQPSPVSGTGGPRDYAAAGHAPGGRDLGDHGLATSSLADATQGQRLIALVELARAGDSDAFGLLYDHYQPGVYRFLYYRVGSVALAEDLTSETFYRALRSLGSFRWQGKDFGAWLTTIARNLATDHLKSGRSRLEVVTEDMTLHDSVTEGPENAVLAGLTTEALLRALREIPDEQQECLVLRFLQSRSIAETAAVLGRTEGAVKQLQLRAVRNLAKRLPEGLR